ncbi:unnamed protein product, partial [Ranitomeya imitator]
RLTVHFRVSFSAEIRSQLVEQFKCLEQQSESRLSLLQDLQEFFRRKAEIELEYSRSLDKLAERFSSKVRNAREQHHFKKDQHLLSPVNCWYLVLSQTRRESKDHATLNDLFLNNVIVRLSHISEDVIRLFKKSKDIGLQMHEELAKVTNELYTVMKTYHMYHVESINAESKLKDAEKQEEKQFSKSAELGPNALRHEDRQQRRSSAKKIEKMKEKRQAKYSENKLKCTKARNEYLLNLAATNGSIGKYYIHDVSDLIDCCDLGFHASLARTFRTYLSAEYNLETSRHEGLDIIENAVDNLDARSDKHKVMDLCNQVFCPPLKFDFQPHMDDEVCCHAAYDDLSREGSLIARITHDAALQVCQVSAQQPVQMELIVRYHQLQSRLMTLKIENEEVRKTLDATMQTLQDMLTVEDFDVSDAFQHSRSTESIKSAASETYMSKLNISKRRANQQETESFYFSYMDNDDSRIRGTLCPSLIGRGNLYDIIVAMATIMTSTSILCPSLNQKREMSTSFMTSSSLCPLLIGRGLAASTNQTRDFYVLYDIIVAKFKEYLNGSNLITKLQAKHDLLKQALGEGRWPWVSYSWALLTHYSISPRPPSLPPKPQKMRKPRPRSLYNHMLFNGNMEQFIQDSGQAIPLVVESCIRYINLYGLQQQGIFRVPGSQVEVNDIKNSFERGEDPLVEDHSERDINSVAGVLKLYFRGLENPLFPKERFQDLMSTIKIENMSERVHHIRQILITLPRAVLVVMRYLFAFLNHLSQYSDENMMDPYNLAICFGPTLMPIPDGQDPVSCQAHVNEVIKTIIVNHELIFPSQRELEGPVYEKCMTGGEE